MAHDALDKFTRQYGRLLMMMRRLVKEEFGVTVHLEETDAPQELLAFASRSRQHLLRQMMGELEDLLGEPSASERAENTEEEKIT